VGRRLGTVVVVVLVVAFVGAALSACSTTGPDAEADEAERATASEQIEGVEGMSTIYLAGGCFWGVEKLMSSIDGVAATEVGYANGQTESPSYEDVVTGQTGYAETVRVDYDPEVAPLPFLLEWFYKGIDPTSLNRQGNDIGTQYRTGIYYSDPADAAVVEASLAALQEAFDEPLVVEAEPLDSFTSAEDYHQDYLEKNPGGYCHIDFALFKEAEEATPEPRHFEY
jgi:peptide methionine sulfoxide reductase msrA/msrB